LLPFGPQVVLVNSYVVEPDAAGTVTDHVPSEV
jgi:hypothetical protein